jgi:hypothetical protein
MQVLDRSNLGNILIRYDPSLAYGIEWGLFKRLFKRERVYEQRIRINSMKLF